MSENSLARGAACLQCRKRKTRCNGLKPVCSRCERMGKQCLYATPLSRKPQAVVRLRQARVLDLEVTVNKQCLSSQHNLSVISARLQERIMRLGMLRRRSISELAPLSVVICCENTKLDALASRQLTGSTLPLPPVRDGDTLPVNRTVVEWTLGSFQWTKGEELPSSMSLYLIGLFLPHRLHFQFFFPVKSFLSCLSLPSSHPASIKPCLRNACCLAACSILGGRWTPLEAYFIQRTRYLLNQTLMLADPAHFAQYLWASALLASYFTRSRRLEESFAVMAAVSPLAKACGIFTTPDAETIYNPGDFLLPPPTTEAEALNTIWLAHSLLMVDRSLSAIAGFPQSLVCEEMLVLSFEHPGIEYPYFKMPIARQEELSRIWQSDVHLNLSTTLILHLVAILPNPAQGIKRNTNTEASHFLRTFIQFHEARIPSFSSVISTHNPHILLSHTTLYGSSLVLYSMFAGEDVKAKAEMLRSTYKLVEICKELRTHGHSYNVHSSLIPMVHMMNAVRVLAKELRGSEARENTKLSIDYCTSIEILLDFLDSVTSWYPLWNDSPQMLKESLTKAIDSLRI
ncbi:hypothetical protein DL93DRAFT_2159673 [Clavulina sp. PMI_390]|nr:hypothetical protein DL93DRAFT_2159673 [Clavulina sp. PMI_390]